MSVSRSVSRLRRQDAAATISNRLQIAAKMVGMDDPKYQPGPPATPQQQAAGVIISPDTHRAQRVPPGQVLYPVPSCSPDGRANCIPAPLS